MAKEAADVTFKRFIFVYPLGNKAIFYLFNHFLFEVIHKVQSNIPNKN